MPLSLSDNCEACTDLAEIPALADQVDMPARGEIDLTLQPLHRSARLMTHQIEAERIDAVVLRPQRRRIDHQLRHHPVFGRGVVAAGRTLDLAVGIEPLVVAGHDAVQH